MCHHGSLGARPFWGFPGAAGQGLASRTHPITSARSRQQGSIMGSSSLRHMAPPWRRAKAEDGCGPAGGPGSVGLTASQGRAAGSWTLALLCHGWGRM